MKRIMVEPDCVAETAVNYDDVTQRLEGYELHERVGRGGLGEVFRATQRSTGAVVAIKVVRDVDGQSAAWRRVERELRALVTLTGHAHVIGVIEVVPFAQGRALVMELAPGGSLAQLSGEGRRWSVPDVVMAGIQVASAVQAAHDRGIVHRDIKPQNVLVDSYGQAKLCDFGIASLLRSEEFRDQTSSISYRFASPEDLEDERELVGPPSDVYSLGATMLYLRRGAPPTSIERVSGFVPVVNPNDPAATELDQIISECLAVDPYARPRVGVVLERLQELERQLERPTRSLLEDGLGEVPAAPSNARPPHDSTGGSAIETPSGAIGSRDGAAIEAGAHTKAGEQRSPRAQAGGLRSFDIERRRAALGAASRQSHPGQSHPGQSDTGQSDTGQSQTGQSSTPGSMGDEGTRQPPPADGGLAPPEMPHSHPSAAATTGTDSSITVPVHNSSGLDPSGDQTIDGQTIENQANTQTFGGPTAEANTEASSGGSDAALASAESDPAGEVDTVDEPSTKMGSFETVFGTGGTSGPEPDNAVGKANTTSDDERQLIDPESGFWDDERSRRSRLSFSKTDPPHGPGADEPPDQHSPQDDRQSADRHVPGAVAGMTGAASRTRSRGVSRSPISEDGGPGTFANDDVAADSDGDSDGDLVIVGAASAARADDPAGPSGAADRGGANDRSGDHRSSDDRSGDDRSGEGVFDVAEPWDDDTKPRPNPGGRPATDSSGSEADARGGAVESQGRSRRRVWMVAAAVVTLAALGGIALYSRSGGGDAGDGLSEAASSSSAVSSGSDTRAGAGGSTDVELEDSPDAERADSSTSTAPGAGTGRSTQAPASNGRSATGNDTADGTADDPTTDEPDAANRDTENGDADNTDADNTDANNTDADNTDADNTDANGDDAGEKGDDQPDTSDAADGVQTAPRPANLANLDNLDRPVVSAGTCLVQSNGAGSSGAESNGAESNGAGSSGDDDFTKVDCATPHDLQMVLGFQLVDPVTPDTAVKAGNLRCAQWFIDEVHGGDVDGALETELTLEATVPDADGLDAGDREGQCWVRVPGERLIGDVAGTGW